MSSSRNNVDAVLARLRQAHESDVVILPEDIQRKLLLEFPESAELLRVPVQTLFLSTDPEFIASANRIIDSVLAE